MVRRSDERNLVVKQMFNGHGQAVGWHKHKGDGEVYYILKGEGEYNDNGTLVTVRPGDVAFVDDGEGHSLINRHDETLEAIALVLYK